MAAWGPRPAATSHASSSPAGWRASWARDALAGRDEVAVQGTDVGVEGGEFVPLALDVPRLAALGDPLRDSPRVVGGQERVVAPPDCDCGTESRRLEGVRVPDEDVLGGGDRDSRAVVAT